MFPNSARFFLPLAAFIFMGCGGSHESRDLPALSSGDGKASLHRVKSTELKAAMRDMNSLVFERFYSEIDRDNMRVRYSKEIAEMARSMAKDIRTIRQIGGALELKDEERQIFLSLAEELDRQSEDLLKVASSHKTEAIQPALDRLVNICNRCHEKFRDAE